MADNLNPDKIELQPKKPEKYTEELNKLTKEIQKIESGKIVPSFTESKIITNQPIKKNQPFKNEAARTENIISGELKKTESIIDAPQEVAPFEEIEPEQEVAPIEEHKPENENGELPAAAPEGRPAATPEEGAATIPEFMKEESGSTFETEETEAEPEKGKSKMAKGEPLSPVFKVEDVLNDSEFVNFLSNYKDSHEIDPISHSREIEKRFELFEAQKSLGKKLIDFYKREVGSELNLPIDEEGEKTILEAIRREAIDRPDALIEKGRELHGYESLKKELEQWDEQISAVGGSKNRAEAIKKLGADIENLEEEKGIKRWSVGFRKWVNPKTNPLSGWIFKYWMSEEERAWRKEVSGMSGLKKGRFFDGINKDIEEMAASRSKLEKWDETKIRDRFEELRQEVFEKFEPTKTLFSWMQKKAVSTIHDLLQKRKKGEKEASLKNIEEARKFVNKLKLGREKFGFSDFEPLEDFDSEVQSRLQKTVEALVHKNISEMKITNKPLNDLMEKINELIVKEKDPAMRDFITGVVMQSLDKAIEILKTTAGTEAPTKSNSTAKLLLLQMARHKLTNILLREN